MWTEINQQLKSILESNTKIQEVYDYEKERFEGDPVATITASENDGDYATTIDNRRIYAFTVRLYVNRTNRNDNMAERIMRELVDTVIDDIDKNYTLTGISNPTGKTLLFVEAVPSRWGYVESDIVMRIAEITIKAHVNVDVTLIT